MSLDDSRHQAFAMALRGYSIREIAGFLGHTPACIGGWIQDKKSELRDHLRVLQQDDYVGMVMARFDEYRRETWENYQKAVSDSARRNYLRLMLDIQKSEIAALQDLGVLGKIPALHEHKHSVGGAVAHGHMALPSVLDGAKLESLSAMLVSEHLSISPEDLLRLGGRYHDPEKKYLVSEVEGDIEIKEDAVIVEKEPLRDFDIDA